MQELQLASVLGLVADLKEQVCPVAFATDASPEGAGIVGCKVGTPVAAEIFRRADLRGFHARLLSPISAYLQEQGMGPQEPEFLLQSDVEERRQDPVEIQALEAGQPKYKGEAKMLGKMPSPVSEWFHKLALRSGWHKVPRMLEFRLDFCRAVSLALPESLQPCMNAASWWVQPLRMRAGGIFLTKACFISYWGCVSLVE